MANDSSPNILWFWAGIGMGAALGAVLGILYAPKSGRETRQAIASTAEQGTKAVRERARRYREQAEQAVKNGRECMTQRADKIRAAVEAGRKAYREATSTQAPEAATSKASLEVQAAAALSAR